MILILKEPSFPRQVTLVVLAPYVRLFFTVMLSYTKLKILLLRHVFETSKWGMR